MPGMTQGCFTIDTFFLSTLECFYSNCCLSVLYFAIHQLYDPLNTNIPLVEVKPLLSDVRPSSRFPPNTSLESITEQMMIEEWNLSYSFGQYYNSCAPSSCTYSRTQHAKNFGQIVIMLISIISGLSSVLRSITPLVVKIIWKLFQPKVNEQQQQQGNNKLNLL